MKKNILIRLAAIALLYISTAFSMACAQTVYNIIVGPEFRSRGSEVEQLLSDLLLTLQKGDTLILTGSGGERRIASITLEANPGENQVVRRRYFEARYSNQIRLIKDFLSELPKQPDSRGNLTRLAKSLNVVDREFPGQKKKIVYLGSPIVQDPAVWSMAKAYPTDGVFFDQSSPYAITGSEQALKNTEIHVVHSVSLSEFSQAYPDIHNTALRRFYAAYFQLLGGQLASWSGQVSHLSRLTINQYPAINVANIDKFKKSAMVEVRSPVQIKADEKLNFSFWASPVSANPPPPSATFSKVVLGITWNCANCDLDLYARADGDDIELSFARQSSKLGRHLKDLLDMTPANKGYETIVFSSPVDLNRLKVAINHYAGTTNDPIDIQFRIKVDDGLYFKSYRLSAGGGNRGGGSRDGARWVQVNLKNVFGL